MKRINIKNIGIATEKDISLSPEDNEKFLSKERQADIEIEKLKQTVNVNFRWSEFEIKRAKKIAKKLGMPYQTYLKSTLKQAMDKDELKFN